MLSRVAENVYWLARYLERAENTARLVSVNGNLLLDLPRGYELGWLPLIDITGSRALFDARGHQPDERAVVQFLLADPDNPGSIAASLARAREDARTLRDLLPAESWEFLNQFFQEFTDGLEAGLNKRTRYNFLKQVVLASQTLSGVLEGTMSRTDAYTFMLMGRNVERADMTSRIVDVRAAQVLPASQDLQPLRTIQWSSVLRSLSGLHMFRLTRRVRISRIDTLDFALRDEQFPRSCLFSLRQLESCLRSLPRSRGAIETLQGACRFLCEAQLSQLAPAALDDLVDELQVYISRVHACIALAYFPLPQGDAGQMQRQFQSQGATLPLFE